MAVSCVVTYRNTGGVPCAGAVYASGHDPGAGRGQGRGGAAAEVARFAPTDLTADITALPANEREALAHMVRAAQVMDALFLQQVWAGNEAMLQTLVKDDSPVGKARLHAFLINKGPWSRLDHNEVFHFRRAAQAASRQLLSGRRHQGRNREVDQFVERPPRRRAPPVSSPQSVVTPRVGSCSCPTTSNTRTSWQLPRSIFSRGGRRHRAAHAESLPRRTRRRVPSTITTTAT